VNDLYLWAFITGLMLGAGISVVTRRKIELQRRWTVFLFFLSAAIVAATVGSLVGYPSGLLDRKLAYMLLGTVVVSTGLFRFPRSLGTLGLVIGTVVAIILLSELRFWNTYESESPFIGFRVLSREDERLSVEWFPTRSSSADRHRTEVVGSDLAFEIELLTAEPYWFFAGSYARLRAFSGDPDARSVITRIPGWHLRVVESEPVSPRVLFPYLISIEEDGTVAIEPGNDHSSDGS
jgi:hypothetical protein